MLKVYNVIDCSTKYGTSEYVRIGIKSYLKSLDIDVKFIPFWLPLMRKIRIDNFIFIKIINFEVINLLFYTFYIFLKNILDEKNFVKDILGLKIKDNFIGDCILSDYYRSINTNIIPRPNCETFFFVCKSIISYNLNIRFFNVLISRYQNLYLYSSETTGRDEFIRRVCISNNVNEIRYSIFHLGFRTFKGWNGVGLRKATRLRKDVYNTIGTKELEAGERKIRSLVSREECYEYMKSIDVDLSYKLEMKPFSPKSTVVIFLSTLSDAQYLYGIGPYNSLNLFHDSIIETFLNLKYNVVVKAHPSMFKDKEYCIKDRKYYNYILQKWKVNQFKKNILRSSINDCLYFVDNKISVQSLKISFPEFMCVTQHGSVATECSFLNIFSVVASNSQYIDQDKFVFILKKESDIPLIVKKWQKFSQYSEHQRVSLYKYIYLNNIQNKLLYGTELFKKIVPPTIDSSFTIEWIKNLENEPGGKKILVDEVCSSVKAMNNNLISLINYN